MRFLGIDLGQTRVGVALSAAAGKMALPLEILERDAEGSYLRRIADLVKERQVDCIVVGLPLTLRGEEGPAAQEVGEFVSVLRQTVTVEIVTWDERFSSLLVEKAMQESGLDSRDRRGKVDAAAATVILQSYLDAHEE